MQELDRTIERKAPARGLCILAAVVALIGLGDAVYLTVNHFTNEPVPCSLISGCEQVLTSKYAAFYGIPTAAFGAGAYFAAFSLAVLAAYENARAWSLFGILVGAMALFTAWLTYLQAFVIGAFCQFCLISAGSTFSLLVIYLLSRTSRFR